MTAGPGRLKHAFQRAYQGQLAMHLLQQLANLRGQLTVLLPGERFGFAQRCQQTLGQGRGKPWIGIEQFPGRRGGGLAAVVEPLEQAWWGLLGQRRYLGLRRHALQGIEQQRRRWLALQVHTAQARGVDATEAAGLRQLFWGERCIWLAKTAYQLREWPLAGLLMLTTPGALAVVRQRWLPGIGHLGVNGPPLLQMAVEALLEEFAVHADEVPALV
ncbi:protein of unknown function, partial [Pseudomonas inefficax]